MNYYNGSDPFYGSLQQIFSEPIRALSSSDAYYDMLLVGEARSCYVKHLTMVYGNWELLLWQNWQLLEDSFAWPWLKEHLYGSRKQATKFMIKNLIRPRKMVSEPTLWCVDGYTTGGYFHWIIDVLPRLWMVKLYLPKCSFALPDYFLGRWPFIPDFFS